MSTQTEPKTADSPRISPPALSSGYVKYGTRDEAEAFLVRPGAGEGFLAPTPAVIYSLPKYPDRGAPELLVVSVRILPDVWSSVARREAAVAEVVYVAEQAGRTV